MNKTGLKIRLTYIKVSFGEKKVLEDTFLNYVNWRDRREVIKWAMDRLGQYRGHTRPPEIKVIMKVNSKVYKTYNIDKAGERMAKRALRRKSR